MKLYVYRDVPTVDVRPGMLTEEGHPITTVTLTQGTVTITYTAPDGEPISLEYSAVHAEFRIIPGPELEQVVWRSLHQAMELAGTAWQDESPERLPAPSPPWTVVNSDEVSIQTPYGTFYVTWPWPASVPTDDDE